MERAKNFSRKKQQSVVKVMDFTEFILDAHNTKSCGNVLNLQWLRKNAPQWIECVKQCDLHRRIIYISSNSILSDDVNALYITHRDHYIKQKQSEYSNSYIK